MHSRTTSSLLGALLVGVPMVVGAATSAPAAAGTMPPAPWVPLTVSGKALAITHESLTLSGEGLPEQILVEESPILAAPMSISLGGVRFHSPGGSASPQWHVAADGETAKFAATLVTSVGAQSPQLEVRGAAVFDGLLTFELHLSNLPAAPASQTISYRLVLADRVAQFLHRYGPVGSRNLILEPGGRDLSLPYLPFLWLGNDDRGLYWFSESPAGWRNYEDSGAIRIVHEGGNVALEVTIVTRAAADGTWTHRFGLLPTPVKSLPPHWRAFRMLPAHGASAYVMWPNRREIGAPYFGYPASLQPEKFARDLASYRQGGITALPYACPTWISTLAPEWQQYGREWRGGLVDPTALDSEWGGEFANICPARGSWKQYVSERFSDFIGRYHLTGIYLDNAQAYAMSDCLDRTNHGEYPEYPLIGQRDAYLSILRALRRNSTSTFELVHSSGGLNLPSFSMVDAWVSGEQYRGLVQDDYLKVASLADFRVELNAAHWGLITLFLPEFSSEVARQVAPTRRLMSLLLLHDATPWPQFANVEEINRDLAMLDKFDVQGAKFVAYYAPRPLASADTPGVYVSGYRKPGSELLIAANLSGQDALARLCFPGTEAEIVRGVRTWPGEEPVTVARGCFDVRIAAGEFSMFHAVRGSPGEL
jgi:hypothetical protein